MTSAPRAAPVSPGSSRARSPTSTSRGGPDRRGPRPAPDRRSRGPRSARRARRPRPSPDRRRRPREIVADRLHDVLYREAGPGPDRGRVRRAGEQPPRRVLERRVGLPISLAVVELETPGGSGCRSSGSGCPATSSSAGPPGRCSTRPTAAGPHARRLPGADPAERRRGRAPPRRHAPTDRAPPHPRPDPAQPPRRRTSPGATGRPRSTRSSCSSSSSRPTRARPRSRPPPRPDGPVHRGGRALRRYLDERPDAARRPGRPAGDRDLRRPPELGGTASGASDGVSTGARPAEAVVGRRRARSVDPPAETIRREARADEDQALDEQPDVRRAREIPEVEVRQRGHEPDRGREDEGGALAAEGPLDQHQADDEDARARRSMARAGGRSRRSRGCRS